MTVNLDRAAVMRDGGPRKTTNPRPSLLSLIALLWRLRLARFLLWMASRV
jgi:hypothetical protein